MRRHEEESGSRQPSLVFECDHVRYPDSVGYFASLSDPTYVYLVCGKCMHRVKIIRNREPAPTKHRS